MTDYPVDLRAEYPERSSRGWAALTILWIKLIALIPHAIVLAFLGIAQAVVAFVAQIVVVITGTYPDGMFRFILGVMRWNTRVLAFASSLTDRYPPFSLSADDSYPIDIAAERPLRSSRIYAAFTVVVQVLFGVVLLGLMVWLLRDSGVGTSSASGGTDGSSTGSVFNTLSSGPGTLVLRNIAAIPHWIVLAILGLVAFFIWIVVQWIILFTANYPRGLFDLVVGITRWRTRVSAYAMGLIDRYPPFTFEPSLLAPPPAQPGWILSPGSAASSPGAGGSAPPPPSTGGGAPPSDQGYAPPPDEEYIPPPPPPP